MSGEATGPGFDPRYDPRFQRGWSDGEPDGAAPAAAEASASPAARAAPPAAPAAPPAAPAAAPAVDPPAPDPTVADPPDVADPAGPEDDPAVPLAAPQSEESPRTRVAEADPAEPAPQDPQPFLLAPSSGGDVSGERDGARVLRIAFTIAWAIAGAATLVGAGLVWSLVSADDPFAVPPGDAELVLRSLAQFAAPSLLATGLLGIVVLTVVDGVRRARRLTAPPAGGDGAAT